jgi:hypothetical protein
MLVCRASQVAGGREVYSLTGGARRSVRRQIGRMVRARVQPITGCAEIRANAVHGISPNLGCTRFWRRVSVAMACIALALDFIFVLD